MGALNEMSLNRIEEQNTVSEDKKSPLPERTTEGTTKETSSTTSFSHTSIIPDMPQKVKGFRCNIDTVAYKTKDEAKKKTGAIVNRTKSESRIMELTPDILSEAVTGGFSFTTAALRGTKEKDFISQQLLVLDNDNEREDIPVTTVEDAIKILTEYHIEYSFIYYSFSHSTTRPKFRIVCVLAEPITEPEQAKRLNQYFISLFPQADKSCFNLDRFYYGTNKGLATKVYDRTTTVYVPADWQPEPEQSAPISANGQTANSQITVKNEDEASAKQAKKDETPPKTDAGQAGEFDLTQAIRDFNLLAYVEQTTGTQGKQHGKDVLFNPCPICGHKDDFYVDTKKNLFKCHSSSNGKGGNIINYIEQQHPEFDRNQARDYFKYDILKRDRNAEKAAYKAKKAEERRQAEQPKQDDVDLSALSTWEEIISYDLIFGILTGKDRIKSDYAITTLRTKAKALRLAGEFDKIITAVKNEISALKRAEFLKENPNGLYFINCPIMLVCNEYRGNEEGIFSYDLCILPQPLVITRRFENAESGIMSVELAFKHQNKWKYHVTSAETIANKSKIVSLADNGLMITTANAADVVQYLLCLQTQNADTIPVVQNVSRLGHMNGEFIPYSDNYIYGGEPSYLPIYNSIHNKGNANEWTELIQEVRDDSISARTVIAATFASPLLQILNLPCFFVHPWGNTGSGKTVSLLVAASAWGNPNEYLRNFNATGVALERTAHFYHNMPFIIDEIQTVRSKYKSENISFGDIIYNLTQGMGRSRGTIHGVEKPLTWKCAFITSGEQPLTSDRSSTGEFNRVLELYETKIFENPSRIYKTVTENYGHAGREFISKLNEYDIPSICDRWNDLIREQNAEASGKQQMIMAALLVADELINRILFGMQEAEAQENTTGYLRDLSTQFTNIKDNDVIQRAYEYVIGWIAENADKFQAVKPMVVEQALQESGFSREQWGKMSRDSKTIFISNNALKEALTKARFNYEATIKGFNEREFVVNDSDSEKNNKNTKRFRLNGILTRGIELKADSFFDKD